MALAVAGTAGTPAASAASGRAHRPAAATRPAVRPNTTLPEEPNLRGDFVAAGPTRLLDTRNGTGTAGQVRKLGQNPLLLDVSQVTGNSSVRPTAVVLNVTVTGPTKSSYLTAYSPDSGMTPTFSSLNFSAGETVANQVVVPVAPDGTIAFYNHAGTTDVIADLAGYFTLDKSASTYAADGPARLLDTRSGLGTGGRKAPVAAGQSISLQVTGTSGVPSDATAVVLNVTATDTTKNSYLTVYPDGEPVPATSSLNFTADRTVPNLVTVPVGADGKVDFYNHAGTTDVIADLAGYYLPDAPQTGGTLRTLDLSSNRLLDTRSGLGTGGTAGKVGPGQSIGLQLSNTISGPATSITAVVLNVTVTNPTKASFLTAYPDGEPVPATSNLNFTADQTVPNLVTVPVGADGKVDFYNHAGSTDVIADIYGYYTSGSSLKLTSLSFADSTVDAAAGGAAVTVDWTLTDSDPKATQTGGEIVIRQKGSAPDSYVGQAYVVDYSSVESIGATLVSGDAAESSYSYSFAVPRYAGTATADWTVSLVTAFEIGTQQEQVLAGSALKGFPGTVQATETVPTATPTYQDPTLQSNTTGAPAYLYVGIDNTAQYQVMAEDNQSGIWKGTFTVSGPGGTSYRGSFEETDDNGQQSGPCQQDIHDPDCYVAVRFPAGAPAGKWAVSSISLTNNAGQTHTYTGLSAAPLTATSDGVVRASGFTATPNPVDSWYGDAPIQVSMRVTGAESGVASIQLFWAGGSPCFSGSPTPKQNADGTWSVTSKVMQSGNGQASSCRLAGAAVVDGAGNAAVYGSDFQAPDPGLTVQGVPDTTPPTASAASLSPKTIAQSQIGDQSFDIIATVSDPTAPVNGFSSYLYDSTGKVVGQEGGGTSVGKDGTALLGIDVPYGLAPGTYTVGFRISDAGWLSTSYGTPNGNPVPGGPLVLTVTSG